MTSITTLVALLAEPRIAITQRRSEAFDELCGGSDIPIVLYGAGGLGRIVARGLCKIGRPPIAFVDRRANAASAPIDGIPLLTPWDAVARFGNNAVFVVSIWNAQTDHRYPATRDELLRLGVRHVAPALAMFWKYPETFLPYYCLDVPERVVDAQDDLRRLVDMLADDASRDVLFRQLRWRLAMDFAALPSPVPGSAYLQPDLVPVRDSEYFVDCGAYDGDTLRMFLPRMEGNAACIVAIEPDPASYARLEVCVSALPVAVRERVRTVKAALGRVRAKVRFNDTGLASARTTDAGGIEVDCLPLDQVLAGDAPTFIKMDLEGAELEALAGGESTIRRARPTMAICVYHRPDHLWKIPLLLRDMLPDHRIHLRPHGYEGWDLVCYAVAPERT